jgi:hypothetical protein
MEAAMSRYTLYTELCVDEPTLLAALAELGFGADALERGGDLPLYGYAGDRRPETADIVIRRRHLLPASNDLGFRRTADGLVPIISEYDRRRLRVGDASFLVALKTAVHTRKALEIARRFGGRITQRREGDRLVIRARR